MRIAIVGPTKTLGGISVHVKDLSKGLRMIGQEVDVIQKIDGERMSSGFYYLRRVLDNYDIVHIQGLQYFTPLVANLVSERLSGSHSIATAHGFGGESHWWKSALKRDLMRAVLRRFDLLVSISYYVQNRLSSFTGLDSSKIVTIYNGVDTSFFNPKISSIDLRKKIAQDRDFIVLYVGRLAWNKGLVDLIQSIGIVRRSFPDIKLIIGGRGRLERELKDTVDSLDLNNHVSFVGAIPQEELPLYYSSSDVVIAPSIFEPFGLVLLEALAMEKPVVATKVGGIPELIINMETGLLVPPKTPSSIADAIITLRNNPSLGRHLGENGRKLVTKEFSLERMAERTLQAYKSVIKGDRHAFKRNLEPS